MAAFLWMRLLKCENCADDPPAFFRVVPGQRKKYHFFIRKELAVALYYGYGHIVQLEGIGRIDQQTDQFSPDPFHLHPSSIAL